MALITCPECGKEASSRATACPQCGCPIEVSAVPAPTGDGAPNPNLAPTPSPAPNSRSPDFSYVFKCVCAVVGSLLILALIGYGCWKFLFGVSQAANNAQQAMTQRSVEQEIAAAQTQIAALKTAIDAYEVDSGHYPKALVELVQQPRNAANWRGPYLEGNAVPKDPWGNDYVYECPGRHNPTAYDLSSLGPPGSNRAAATPKQAHAVTKAEWRQKVESRYGQDARLGIIAHYWKANDFKQFMGEPSSTQTVGDQVCWYYECSDGTIQLSLDAGMLAGGVMGGRINDF